MPLVSVVIPTYNQADYLREALQSVLDQTVSDWEVIVINNNSSDHTVEVVEAFKDCRFQLINFSNNGIIGASRNLGIKNAKSPWVAFLDSDDLWYPEKLELCMKETDGADIIAHRFELVKNNCVVHKSLLVKEKDFLYRNLILKGNCLAPTTTIVRKTLLDEVGGFSEKKDFVTVEDFDLWLKMSSKQASLRFISQVLAKYRLHDSNASSSAIRLLDAALKVLEKHYNLLEKKRGFDFVLYWRIIAVLYYQAGRKCLMKGDRRNAIQYFLKSFKRYPFYIKNYIFFLIALFSLSAKR
jgi:glycosyltransferase involved in cell wall biosynthesis